MELPEDVLKIIKEYAKPITRPDWRICGHMSHQRLISQLNIIHFKNVYQNKQMNKVICCLINNMNFRF